MITITSEIDVKGISGKAISDFLLNCADEDYQRWWKGVHLLFHTVKRYPDNIGNLVYFDEYVGKYRLKCHGVITEILPDKKIVWRMKKFVKLPAWLAISFEDNEEGVKIIHVLTAGYKGIGSLLDPILRLFLSKKFEKEMDEHAQAEFVMLRDMLTAE